MSTRRGDVSVMFQQLDLSEKDAAPPSPRVVFYFVCHDVDAIHAEFAQRGLELDPPVEAHYGMKQLPIPDPDGYAIVFESPTESWSG